MKDVEKDLLWGALSLDSLLGDTNQSFDKKVLDSLPKGKKEVVIKHQNMLKKPTYNAIMNRYNNIPHKPKVILKSKLDRLADPILGRLTHQDIKKYENILGEVRTPSKPSNISPTAHVNRPEVHSDEKPDMHIYESEPEDAQGGLFSLTSTNSIIPSPQKTRTNGRSQAHHAAYDSDNYLDTILEQQTPQPSPRRTMNSSISPKDKVKQNIRSSKNGFASAFRNQVKQAEKLNKLIETPLEEKLKQEEKHNKKIMQFNYGMNSKFSANNSRAKDLPFQQKRGLSNRYNNKNTNKKPVVEDPFTNRLKKVKSSGYGALRGRSLPNSTTTNSKSTRGASKNRSAPIELQPIKEGRKGASAVPLQQPKPTLRSSRSTPMFTKSTNKSKKTTSSSNINSDSINKQEIRKSKTDSNLTQQSCRQVVEEERRGRSRQRAIDRFPTSTSNINSDSEVDHTNTSNINIESAAVYGKKRSAAKSVAALYNKSFSNQPVAVNKRYEHSDQSVDYTSASSSSPRKTASNRQGNILDEGKNSSKGIRKPALSRQNSNNSSAVNADIQSLAEVITAEEQAMIDDLETTMNKLRKYDKKTSSISQRAVDSIPTNTSSSSSANNSKLIDNNTLYTKGDVEATFAKHALRLGSNITNVESKLKQYSEWKNNTLDLE
jgi:hypothetical protein